MKQFLLPALLAFSTIVMSISTINNAHAMDPDEGVIRVYVCEYITHGTFEPLEFYSSSEQCPASKPANPEIHDDSLHKRDDPLDCTVLHFSGWRVMD